MAADWDEIKRLAADFQRAQLSSTTQRLSERNCVELVTKLIDQKLLDVVFTTDGKEYVTPEQLNKEIEDELYIQGGRIDIVELAKILNVDFTHVSTRVKDLECNNKNLKLILGQLVDKSYLNRIAVEINEKLVQQGQINIGDLVKQYDLQTEFLLSVVESQLRTVIKAKQDPTDRQVFFTDAFVTRNKVSFRGAIMAATCPTSIGHILAQSGVQERLFTSIMDSLVEVKQIPGTITSSVSGNGLYIPAIYSKAQNDWVNNFYKQNGYLEYDALTRLGIGDPSSFIQRTFQSEKLQLLKACAIGPQLISHIEAAVEEAISSSSFMDILSHLPLGFEPEDCSKILNEVLKTLKTKNSVQNVHVFCNTFVVPDQFLQSLNNLFEALIKKKAEESVSSGAYLTAQAESKVGGKMGLDVDDRDFKADRKEERRKKATGGKGGGGTQGRETKTKSTKKKYMRGKAGGDDFDSDDEPRSAASASKSSKQSSGKLEFFSVSEIQSILEGNEVFQDEEYEELIEEIAKYLYLSLNKATLSAAQAIYESTMASTAQSRRKTHSELQEKLNALVTNVRLFDKGIKTFSDNDLQQQLSKYLLKTLCTDITNDVFSYIAQENMVQYDLSEELTPEMRLKIVNALSSLPNDIKEPLLKLHKSLSGSSVDNFLSCLEASIGSGLCDMVLRKPDKKKERPLVYAHRQSLLEQLSVAKDPAVVLHVASLVIFQTISQTMLHASGRFVSNILTFLRPQLSVDMFNTLQLYHDLVLKLLKMDGNDPDRNTVVTALQDGMPGIKEMANMVKRPSVSEKS